MNVNFTLQKLERGALTGPKVQFMKQVSKGDSISIIYYELEKERIRLQQFTGMCTKLKSRGLNTKVYIRNVLGNTTVDKQFFLFSKSLLDIAILRDGN